MSEEIKNTSSDYSADSIQVLEGLEAVRKRPAMYIGDISEKGLHHLVYEVVDNSIDEALAGYCTMVDVVINEDNSIVVTDNGRGIPVDIHEKEGKSALEVVLTVLHAGGKFDKGTYKVSGGLHGVGVSCVNALSTYLKAEVRRNGHVYMQEFSCGKPLHDVQIVGDSDTTGTTITFKPDGSIFTVTEYKYDILATRLRELAFLNAGITLRLTDKRAVKEDGLQPDVIETVEKTIDVINKQIGTDARFHTDGYDLRRIVGRIFGGIYLKQNILHPANTAENIFARRRQAASAFGAHHQPQAEFRLQTGDIFVYGIDRRTDGFRRSALAVAIIESGKHKQAFQILQIPAVHFCLRKF